VLSSHICARYGSPAHARGKAIVAGDPVSFHPAAATTGYFRFHPECKVR